MGKAQPFQQMLLKYLDIYMQKKSLPHEFRTLLHILYKNYLNMDQIIKYKSYN